LQVTGAAADALAAAVARLRAGGLVAYATETLYGLAADARSEAAVAGLRRWKGRAEAHPLTVLVPDADALAALGVALPGPARALAERFWPGPLTLVLPARRRLARGVGREDGALGVRCSPHPVARALAREAFAAGLGPPTATSLNRTGAPPARTRAEAVALCTGAPDAPWLLELAGAPEPAGDASSVVDLTTTPPTLLREGALARAALEPIAGALAPAGEAGR